MPNPEQSNNNISGSTSGQFLVGGAVSNPFQELADMPKFEDHMADMQNLEQNKDNLTESSKQTEVQPTDELDSYEDQMRRRGKEKIERMIREGMSSDQILSKLAPKTIARQLDFLAEHGIKVDTDELVSKLKPESILEHLDSLIQHGANIDASKLADMDPDFTAEHFDDLVSRGAQIDANKLASKLESKYGADAVAEHLDALISHNAQIDANELASKISPKETAENLDLLISHGAEIDINELVSKLDSRITLRNLDSLIDHGAKIDIRELVLDTLKFEKSDVAHGIRENMKTLLGHGVTESEIAGLLFENGYILPGESIKVVDDSENLDANRDPNESFIDFVENRNDDAQVKEKLSEFISDGVDVGYIINFFCYRDGSIDENGTRNIELDFNDPSVTKGFEELLQYIDINQILPRLSTETVALNRKYLESKGANLKAYEENINRFFSQTEQEMKNAGLL